MHNHIMHQYEHMGVVLFNKRSKHAPKHSNIIDPIRRAPSKPWEKTSEQMGNPAREQERSVTRCGTDITVFPFPANWLWITHGPPAFLLPPLFLLNRLIPPAPAEGRKQKKGEGRKEREKITQKCHRFDEKRGRSSNI